MNKIISNIIAIVIILTSIFFFAMSAIMLIVTDWGRWSEAVPMFGIAFAVLLALSGWWCMCLVPHFAAPFKIRMPSCIKRWLEENNKAMCPHIHTGYEPVPVCCQFVWYGMGQEAQAYFVEDHVSMEEAIATFEKYASDTSFVNACLYVNDKLVARAYRYSFEEYEIVIV